MTPQGYCADCGNYGPLHVDTLTRRAHMCRGRYRAVAPSVDRNPGTLGCLDCGAPYSEFPLDTTLPDEQWMMIHSRAGGVLCGSCIVRRAAKLPGAIAIRAVIEFADAVARGPANQEEPPARAASSVSDPPPPTQDAAIPKETTEKDVARVDVRSNSTYSNDRVNRLR